MYKRIHHIVSLFRFANHDARSNKSQRMNLSFVHLMSTEKGIKSSLINFISILIWIYILYLNPSARSFISNAHVKSYIKYIPLIFNVPA